MRKGNSDGITVCRHKSSPFLAPSNAMRLSRIRIVIAAMAASPRNLRFENTVVTSEESMQHRTTPFIRLGKGEVPDG